MKNLYIKSKYKDQRQVNKAIKDYIEISYKIARGKTHIAAQKIKNIAKVKNYNKIKESGLQSRIDILTNLQAYTRHRNNKLYFNHFNKLYLNHSQSLDSLENNFTSAFPNAYQQRVFELVMAEFFHKKFTLTKRETYQKGNPDFEFSHQSTTYYLECTTRNSSLMDKFIEQLPAFDSCLKAAKIFNRCKQQLIDKGEFERETEWHIMMEQLWYRLSTKQKQRVVDLLNSTSPHRPMPTTHSENSRLPEWIFKKLENWLSINSYAFYYFKTILPPTLIKKIKNILPKCRSDDMDALSNFFIKSIVQLIIWKVENKYFEKNIPVILTLSLATLPDFMSVVPAFNDFERMAKLITDELIHNIDDYISEKKNREKIHENIKSLYAIVIDTTWYNWVPEIVELELNAKWPDNKLKNCYIVIYNTQIKKSLSFSENILSSLVHNQISLPFSTKNKDNKELTATKTQSS